MKQFFKTIGKKLKEQAGMTSIEVGIVVLISIVALGGFVDMVNNSQKLDTASSVTGYVGRVVANQGGIRTAPTEHHVGNYVTSQQLYREVQLILKNGGIPDEDFTLLVNNSVITPDTNLPTFDFGERMNIELKVRYGWDMIAKTNPLDFDSEKVSSRVVTSSFKVRDEGMKTDY